MNGNEFSTGSGACGFSALMQGLLAVLDESDAVFLDRWDRPRSIRRKGAIDLVTDTDLAIEALLKKRLAELLPGAEFLAEESAESLTPGRLCWIIDPVDGTTNFAHHFGDACTSVALWRDGAPVLGAVSAPVRGERYTAEKGRGAFLSGRPVHVSSVASCTDALVATGFPYTVKQDMPAVLRDMETLLAGTVGVRRCGSAALDLCFTACGSFDAYFEGWIKPWDVAAGWLIVEEAGGRVTGRNGGPYVFNTPILASNGLVHDELAGLLQLEGGKLL